MYFEIIGMTGLVIDFGVEVIFSLELLEDMDLLVISLSTCLDLFCPREGGWHDYGLSTM